MTRDTRKRNFPGEDRWGLRTERASTAVSRFCLAWIDAGRDLGFGVTSLALRTAEDLSEASCPSPRQRAPGQRAETRSETSVVETVEVRRPARRA